MGKYEQLAHELVPDLAPWFLKYGSAYEEGTWTPTFSGTSTNGSYTYVLQEGSYTRIGNTVFFRGRIQISNIGTNPTGSIQIRGLGFTSSASAPYGALNWAYISNFNYSAGALELLGAIGVSSS